jgi:predicted peroxiredoxin
MSRKFVIFAFNGNPMCYVHALLNALDYADKGCEVKLVLEGEATKMIERFEDPEQPFAGLYRKVVERGLLDCVCRACSHQMGVLKLAEERGLPLCDDMSGHPSMERYTQQGFEVVIFG